MHSMGPFIATIVKVQYAANNLAVLVGAHLEDHL